MFTVKCLLVNIIQFQMYYINGINYYANDFITLLLVTFNTDVL